MTTCRWTSSTTPRVLVGRHDTGCRGIVAFRGDADYDECPGCLPCPGPHCPRCRTAHSDGACPECVGEVRQALRRIGELNTHMPAEASHRGVQSEAMMLTGPTADVEAWHHRRASALAGRILADYLNDCRDERHPLWVLGTWEMVWRDHLEHDTDDLVTIAGAVDYLDRQMTYMATQEVVPFEDFARDTEGCLAHLENVLHDGERAQSGAPCVHCRTPLIRQVDRNTGGLTDDWTCTRCHRDYDEQGYRNAVAAAYVATQTEQISGQTWATLDRAAVESGRSVHTIRTWIREGVVARACVILGRRNVVSVDDVRTEDETRKRRVRRDVA